MPAAQPRVAAGGRPASTGTAGAGIRRRSKEPTPIFTWKTMTLCVIVAVPLAIAYRQVLIPFLASLEFVRLLKAGRPADAVTYVATSVGFSAQSASYAVKRIGQFLDGLLMWMAGIDPVVLMVVFLSIVAFAWGYGRLYGKKRAVLTPEQLAMEAEMASIQAELQQVLKDLDEWQQEAEEAQAAAEAQGSRNAASAPGQGATLRRRKPTSK